MRQRRPRRQVCWHCGHTGHIRQRCFRRMRQRRRQGCLRDAVVDAVSPFALTVARADTVLEYTSDGDVTFALSYALDDVMHADCALPLQWLLDADATFHVTL